MWFGLSLLLKDSTNSTKYSIKTIVYKDEAGNEYPVRVIVDNTEVNNEKVFK